MVSTRGVLYTFPWERWGNWKYLIFVMVAVRAYQETAQNGVPMLRNLYAHLLMLSSLRYLNFQIWCTASRLPCISRKYRIQTKGIKFEQVDHEAGWENMIFLGVFLVWGVLALLPTRLYATNNLAWNGRGVALAFLIHMGPIEWIYYWAHRALHHHYLFSRYHFHHHSSFVTQPITSSNHPMLEHLFYHTLFGIVLGIPYVLGCASFSLLYIYILFVDFMNAWGHCNFEFIPTFVFDLIPLLKYIIYSPTFHSLHHSKIHTNFSLFMPLYDYLYGTFDETSYHLHQVIREGHENKVDCVYVTHATELLSIFHLQFGFQTFAAQSYTKKWYMWALWPIAFPIMVVSWLFAKPFIGATHLIGERFELQTWVIPRFNFQYNMESEKSRIDGWIEQCVLQAQQVGAKVVALGLLNKDRLNEKFLISPTAVSIPIVTGETLVAAIIVNKMLPLKPHKVFISPANSRVGRAISTYLCEHGVKVMALFPSMDQFEDLHEKVALGFQQNLMYATHYEDGKDCKVWVVGETIGMQEQRWAPLGTHFYQFNVFQLHTCRLDCTYESIPGLRLPNNAKTINACEDVMPRYVVRACYAAAIIHALEGWCHNDFISEISTYHLEASWEAALKHGFLLDNKES